MTGLFIANTPRMQIVEYIDHCKIRLGFKPIDGTLWASEVTS
jgi:hypothetical protein